MCHQFQAGNRAISFVTLFIMLAVARAEPPAVVNSRTDLHGDLLPDRAIARLGTVRFNHGDPLNTLHFTPDGKWALVSNIQSGNVSIIDTKARRIVDSITFKLDSSRVNPTMLGRMNGSAQPLGILMAPDGSKAWIALAAQDQIAEVDLKTRKVIRYINTGREPDGMGYLSTLP